ncbi:MAG: DUF975 family protein [Eubacteriales bacterium]|nr:DUF975 family protein [Eubacteriales bacterium]
MSTHSFTVGQLHAEAYEILKKRFWWCAALSGVLYGLVSILGSLTGAVYGVLMLPTQMLALLADSTASSTSNLLLVLAPVLIGFWLLMYVMMLAISAVEGAIHYAAIPTTFQIIDDQKPDIGKSFSEAWKQCKRLLLAAGWVILWTALWSLLFVVPGIIKGYAYRLTPYLVLEYPGMPVRKAMRLSMQLTQGYKGRLFVIDLMLFGWALLSALLICTIVGPIAAAVLWVTPMGMLMNCLAYRNIMEYAREKDMFHDA